jgi:hypothetical protein
MCLRGPASHSCHAPAPVRSPPWTAPATSTDPAPGSSTGWRCWLASCARHPVPISPPEQHGCRSDPGVCAAGDAEGQMSENGTAERHCEHETGAGARRGWGATLLELDDMTLPALYRYLLRAAARLRLPRSSPLRPSLPPRTRCSATPHHRSRRRRAPTCRPVPPSGARGARSSTAAGTSWSVRACRCSAD